MQSEAFGKRIRGVNLGNWLVLEKWMSEELFEGTSARDEEEFYRTLPPDVARDRLRMHRNYFIQERDFAHIASLGLNAVRIPVPHYVFGDEAPYVGCIDYLDQAFSWAERYGIAVLVDIHTVPGSQNGFDNGGLTGVVSWHHNPANIDATVELAGRLAQRYAGSPTLWGIELLNEPVSKEMRAMTRDRYVPRNPVITDGNDYVPSDVLRDYYERGYEAVRQWTTTAKVVLHDGFRLPEWQDFMTGPEYQGVVLDSHLYLGFEETAMQKRDLGAYARLIQERFSDTLAEASRAHDIIVGEWCVANKCAELDHADASTKRWVHRVIGDLELKAWEQAAGWFFWSYKLHVAGRADWDLCQALDRGWLAL